MTENIYEKIYEDLLQHFNLKTIKNKMEEIRIAIGLLDSRSALFGIGDEYQSEIDNLKINQEKVFELIDAGYTAEKVKEEFDDLPLDWVYQLVIERRKSE
jgi:hypothetical protein